MMGICVSTPGKPQSQAQMLSRVFSSGVCGAWSVAIMSIVPSISASHSGWLWRASRTGGFTRRMPPRRSMSAVLSSRYCGQVSTVTSTPRALAARSRNSESAALWCAMCTRAPVHSASVSTRPMASISATAGRAARCACASMRPASCSCFWRRAMIDEFSACTTVRTPSGARISKPSSSAPSLGAGRLPKVLPTKALKLVAPPSSRSSSRCTVSSPSSAWMPKSTKLRSAAFSFIASASRVPVGGWVFGMSNTVVTPPQAAAAEPVAQVSLCG